MNFKMVFQINNKRTDIKMDIIILKKKEILSYRVNYKRKNKHNNLFNNQKMFKKMLRMS